MKQKTRGFIDPYTLGFLISLIGTIVAVETHSDRGQADGAETRYPVAASQTDKAIQKNLGAGGRDAITE